MNRPKRRPKQPEDKILGMVFNRLRLTCGARYEDISKWTKEQGSHIPVSCLCDISAGRASGYLSRIPLLTKYFREVQGMDYVTESYMLQGSEIELEKVQNEREAMRVVADSIIPLPLEEFAERETA